MSKKFIFLFLTFFIFQSIILSQECNAQPNSFSDRFLEKYDTNSDGQVEKSEFDGSQKRFEKWDTNGDGYIAGEELDTISNRFRKEISGKNKRKGPPESKVAPDHQGHLFISRFDQNGDQLVSKNEFTGDKNRFQELDKNQDGNISIEEYSSIAGKQNFNSKQNNPKKNTREDFINLLSTIDVDGSESLSLEEFTQNSHLLFEVLDRNKDQQLDGVELGVHPKQRSKQSHKKRERGMSPEQRANRMIETMDVDNNGFIDIEEWRGPEEAFREADLDQNNLVNAKELIESRTFEHQAQRRIKYFMSQHDQNEDGEISEDEFKGSPDFFNKMDLDQDGYITPEEILKIGERRRGRSAPRN